MLEIDFQPTGRLPRGKDLPDTDGKPLDSEAHRTQASKYLIEPLQRWFKEQEIEAFVGGNSIIYYPPPAKRGQRGLLKPKRLGPDFYVVNSGRNAGQNKWVVWEEQNLYPSLIVELVSPSTESKDRGQKFVIYRDIFKTKDFYLFDTTKGRLEGFHLVRRAYVSVQADQAGRQPCSSLPLSLGVHEGWLRFFTPQGLLLPTDEELAADAQRQAADAQRQAADAQRQAADAQRQAADAQRQLDLERSRAERLADRLRQLGIEE